MSHYFPWPLPPVDDLPLLLSLPDLSPPSPLLVVCNAPLVAPIPLPYHSPTFLQFDLPDIDQDLSHPPYTCRSSKRKRASDELPKQQSPHKKPFLHQPSAPRPRRHLSDTVSQRHQTALVKRARVYTHT